MRHYKIVYIKRDAREVWIEVSDNTDEEGAEDIFVRDLERYDDESDEANVDIESPEIIEVTEIDEFGEELDGN
jgi:hypothetical protein